MAIGWKNTTSKYGWLSVSLHWTMLLLIVAAYVTMEIKSVFPKGSPGRETLALWHYTLGLSVFGLVWLRLLARLAGQVPAIEPPLPAVQAQLARVVQLVLYALMMGLPLLGWLTLSARGKPVPFLGAELPALADKSLQMALELKEIHESIATAGYFLIGLHAAAALYHHYAKRDNTLRLMLPWR